MLNRRTLIAGLVGAVVPVGLVAKETEKILKIPKYAWIEMIREIERHLDVKDKYHYTHVGDYAIYNLLATCSEMGIPVIRVTEINKDYEYIDYSLMETPYRGYESKKAGEEWYLCKDMKYNPICIAGLAQG